MDQLLEPLLAAPETDPDETLGVLLTSHAAPIIRRVISSRLRQSGADADDVSSQVLMQLLLRLRQGKTDRDLSEIHSFAGYVATAAHHGCDHYLRRKYPLRWRLRNRIRYVLEHDPRFGVWKSTEGTWLCGVAAWQSRGASRAPSPEDVGGIDKQRVRDLLLRAFELSEGPLELSTVVDLAAAVWRIPLFQDEDATAIEAVPDAGPRTDVLMAQRGKAAHVWEEICALPVRQRHALLLNLKDDALSLFLMTGTASLRAIAGSLDLPVETLATLWNHLPLPDNDVAIRLGCTRQQVINLRMAARKRLANRLAGWS
jgi:DNA-directed RNA polymerase specialized sigma24 family protein